MEISQISAAATLSERLAKALALVEEAITDDHTKLSDGPDNPAIKRHSKTVTAFSISFSEIGKGDRPSSGSSTGSWDPFFYDWLAQYRFAQELLVKRKFSALRDLLAGGGYRDPSKGFRVFAPQVIEHIKTITGDLQSALLEVAA